MSYVLGSEMGVVQPCRHILAFYDGRIPGLRVHSDQPNWLDDGAFGLGTVSFAIVDGTSALVYDTHMSIPHAQLVRDHLEGLGITDMVVVLSHRHPDHVAGNIVFEDCEIIANRHTARLMEENRDNLENGDPPIAGDTVGDTVTYVTEPDRLHHHLADLARMATWDFDTILPNHGTLEKIASAGYDKRFITATELYVNKLTSLAAHPEWAAEDLRTFAAEPLALGAVEYFEPYEWCIATMSQPA